ncbi:MAG: hypothetical protein ACK5PF_05705, partial [bacterium]
YITIWTYVIYHYICSMLADNASVCARVDFDLKGAFDFEVKGALAQSVRKITDKNYSLSAFGIGGEISNSTSETRFDFEKANAALRDFIIENIDELDYYVIFDELDEDYRDVLNPDRRDGYFELLISLFKAVQNIRAEFSGAVPNIRMVILCAMIFLISVEMSTKTNGWTVRFFLSGTKVNLEISQSFVLHKQQKL